MNDFSFETLDTEDLSVEVQKSKQKHADEILVKLNCDARKQLQQIGMRLLQPAFANRVAKNPVTQEQYNARRYVLRAILREPKRTLLRYPVKETWKEMYKNIPYWDKATSAPLQKFEKQELKDFSKTVDCFCRQTLQTVQDFLKMAELVYKTTRVDELTKELKEYKYLIDTKTKALVYKGYVLKYSSKDRAYVIKLGNKLLKITEGNIRKQQEVFDAIDKLDALCS